MRRDKNFKKSKTIIVWSIDTSKNRVLYLKLMGRAEMKSNVVEQLSQALIDLEKQYFKQVYISEYKQSKTLFKYSELQDIPYINLNLELSSELKDIPRNRRTFKVTDIFNTLIQSYPENTICIDYYELLFEPSLSINSFDLFKSASRNKTLIIAWRGTITRQEFIHAAPGHPEYKKYPIEDILILK